MKRIGTVIATVVLLLVLTACGGGVARSVEAYCDTVAEHRDRYQWAMEATSSSGEWSGGLLLGAVDASNSSGELDGILAEIAANEGIKDTWADLAEVAPDEIRSDTESVKQAWDLSVEAARKGRMDEVFTNVMMYSQPTDRVNMYVAEHCGPEYAPTAPPDTPTATPTDVSSAVGTSGVVHVRDQDGYTFDITYTYSPHRVEQSLANDKPGFSSAITRLDVSITITNTTPGRTLTFDNAGGITAPGRYPVVALLASWGATSPVCEDIYDSNDRYSARHRPDDPCNVWLGFGRISQPLAPGETRELHIYSGLPSGQGVAGLAGIPDASYEAVSAGLEDPDNYHVIYQGANASRFGATCGEIGDPDGKGSSVGLFAQSGARCAYGYRLPQPQSVD